MNTPLEVLIQLYFILVFCVGFFIILGIEIYTHRNGKKCGNCF